jgi:hypothetical protein
VVKLCYLFYEEIVKMKKLEISYNLIGSNVVLLDVNRTYNGYLVFRVGGQVPETKQLVSGTITVKPNLAVDKYTYEDFSIAGNQLLIELAKNIEITQDCVCI